MIQIVDMQMLSELPVHDFTSVTKHEFVKLMRNGSIKSANLARMNALLGSTKNCPHICSFRTID